MPVMAATDATTQAYTQHYLRAADGPRYPAEHLVRIFLGRHPRLHLNPLDYAGAPLLEVGCGDGRNLGLFHRLGFNVHGSEISEAICAHTRTRIATEPILAHITPGTSDALPWPDAHFRYLVAWNSCYYLRPGVPFAAHVAEYARVLQPGGILVLSVPMPTNYIFMQSESHADDSVTLTGDAFGVLAGARLQRFGDAEALQQAWSGHFANFVHGEVRADTFGIRNDHFLLVTRRSPVAPPLPPIAGAP